MVGKTIWSVRAGRLTGSSFSIDMGRKLRLRVAPRPFEYRAADGKKYRTVVSSVQPQGRLLVWCTWRLDSRQKPLTSSDDINRVLRLKLKRHLVGRRVTGVEVRPPACDLRITLSGGLVLNVFCDHVPGEPSFDGNWQMRLGNDTAAVQPGGVIRFSVSDYLRLPSTRKPRSQRQKQ